MNGIVALIIKLSDYGDFLAPIKRGARYGKKKFLEGLCMAERYLFCV